MELITTSRSLAVLLKYVRARVDVHLVGRGTAKKLKVEGDSLLVMDREREDTKELKDHLEILKTILK